MQRDCILSVHLLRFVHYNVEIDMFLYVRMEIWVKMTKKRQKHPPQGDDASTV